MIKIKIAEYSVNIIIVLFAALIYLKIYWGAAIVYLLWYLAYGFVGLSFYFSTRNKTALSDFLLRITFYPTLLPFRKAFYFLTKSFNVIFKDTTDTEKAYSLAKKVNVDKLYTDNNKAMYYSFLASLHFDLGDKALAEEYIEIARKLPHKKIVGESINRISEYITRNSEN